MASIAAFIPRHLTLFRPMAGDAVTVAGLWDLAERLTALKAKTILSGDGGMVLGIIGAAPSVPGVCEVFVLASEDQKDFPVSFARKVRNELSLLRSKYRRIQAITANDKFHKRWITWLGFEQEGILKRYGLHGEDMIMWGLTQ